MNYENIIVNYVIQTLILENNLRIRYVYISFDNNTLLQFMENIFGKYDTSKQLLWTMNNITNF